MHPTDREVTASVEVDVSGLWFCTSCGDIHREATCPTPDQWFLKNEARVVADVRLCACCARAAVPSGSPFASFFCSECGTRIAEVNRSLGRLVVPLCRDLGANLALLPAPGDPATRSRGVAGSNQFLGSQIELLEEVSYYRTMWLLDRLRLPRKPILLETYLREVVQLRHESFHAQAALGSLLNRFHEYLIEIPSESPELAARVRKKAHAFARGFRRDQARRLLESGPAVLREVAAEWVRRVIDEVQPLPSCVSSSEILVLERRGRTYRALRDAAIQCFFRTHGRPKRPAAPTLPPRLAAKVLSRPGEEWPDFLPRACPTGAHLVVGLERTPAAPDMPLSVYHLSMDRRHRWWVLWADVADDEGFMEPAPVAWCPRSSLRAKDAAFILLEGSLKKDRETYGTDRRRPGFGMPGLLDEDLTDVLLDLVWSGDG